MNPIREFNLVETRRHFFGRAAGGIGSAALASLLNGPVGHASNSASRVGGLPELPHFAPKAKRVIYLFMSGAPSQLDTTTRICQILSATVSGLQP